MTWSWSQTLLFDVHDQSFNLIWIFSAFVFYIFHDWGRNHFMESFLFLVLFDNWLKSIFLLDQISVALIFFISSVSKVYHSIPDSNIKKIRALFLSISCYVSLFLWRSMGSSLFAPDLRSYSPALRHFAVSSVNYDVSCFSSRSMPVDVHCQLLSALW